MAAALATALESVSGQASWQIELAGGSRRKRPAATPAGASSTEPWHASVQGPDAAQAGSHGSGAVVEGQRGDASSGDAGAAELAGGGLAAGSRSTIGGSKFITGILAGRHHDADFVIRCRGRQGRSVTAQRSVPHILPVQLWVGWARGCVARGGPRGQGPAMCGG